MSEHKKMDFARGFSEYSGYTVKHCIEIYRLLEEYIAKELKEGGTVRISGVCTLGSKVRPPFTAYSFPDKKVVEYPSNKMPYCKFMPSFTRAIRELPCDD